MNRTGVRQQARPIEQGHPERGIALVFTLFLLATLSVLTISFAFLAQSETYASANYRLVTQARYAAESGAQKASDYLLGANYNAALVAPGIANNAVSPVTWNGQPVILSAVASQPSNYPDAATVTAFQNAVSGTLAAASTNITFGAYATLLTEDSFQGAYGSGTQVIQTWQITSNGTINGVRNATVQVSAMIETIKAPTVSYAAFGTDPGCGSLTFVGNDHTDSYSSSGITGGTSPAIQSTGGDLGTNGNLTIQGHVDVQGNLSSPQTGVGACSNGNVTALTETGNVTLEGGSPQQLPQVIAFATPPIPSPSPLAPVSSIGAGTCATLGLTAANCTVSGSTIYFTNTTSTPLTLPSFNLSGGGNIVLVAPTTSTISNQYNFSSITLAGGSSVGVQTDVPSHVVTVNINGLDNGGNPIGTPISFAGGTYTAVTGCATCSNYDARILTFVYGGTGTISMVGNSQAAAVFYAPNAQASFVGTSDLYGSIIAKDVQVNGNVGIHYDTNLQASAFMKSNPMMTSFSWKKY